MEAEVAKTVLENGIRVVTQKMPNVRSISMGVWVNVGARDESSAESGLSHMIEHMIFKGTAKRTAFQIAKEFDAIGGNSNAFTSMEHTCYHAKVLDTHMASMVEILSDIFLNSVFDELEIGRERAVILQEISMVEDNPEEFVHLLAGGNFWGDHPLGRSILGSRENVLGFDAKAVREFFHRLYQPERIVVSAAGNFDHDRLVAQISRPFASIRPGNGIAPRKTPETNARCRAHARSLEQAHLCLTAEGLPITDAQRYSFSLLNTILGGNMSSRLFQEIRERRGLAYSVYSFIISYVDSGMFGVYAGVEPKSIGEAIGLIVAEMRRLAEAGIDSGQLRDAKEYTKGCLLLAAENTDSQMVRLAQNEIHYGAYVPLESVVEAIEAVTPDEIRTLAARLFQPDKFGLTLLGTGIEAGCEALLAAVA